MRVHRSSDPLYDFAMRERERQEWEDSLPHCVCCGDPIDEYVWHINDETLCDDCAREKYRRDVEDYVGGDRL